MADALVSETGVNDGSTGSPAVDGQNDVTTPPAGENPASTSSENRIPQSRLNEVIEQRNRERALREQMEARLTDFEKRLPPAKAAGEEEIERLVKRGVTKEIAEEVVRTAEAVGDRKSRQVEARLAQYQLAEWHRNMESKYKDYRETTSEMEKVFSSLPLQTQAMCTSSEAGLDMLYHYAKSAKGIDKSREAFVAGAQSVQTLKDQKAAVSSGSGRASVKPIQDISPAYLASIRGNTEEYQKNLKRINHWLATGKQS